MKLFNRVSRRIRSRSRKRPLNLSFEFVEDCELLATFTVTSAVDPSGPSGTLTLRQAIDASNATPGPDTIDFNTPGPGVHTIAPTSALPAIPDPVIIDGYTQPGASPNTLAVGDNAVLLIDLSGAAAGIGVDGLVISAGGSTVRGLIINDFVAGPSTPGFIPNGGKGISLGTAGGNTIVGNFIGTDPSGGIAQPNTFSGVLTTTAGNQIGGTAPGDRNVISGNNVGVFFLNAAASGNLLRGNYIGVNAAGTADLGNTNVGVQINNAPGNTIGGTAAGSGNVISGNDLGGIDLANSSASGNLVQGNLIGTDASGTTALGNGFGGVSISDAPNNTIGGANTIAFNSGPGVQVNGSNARGNSILSNSTYSNTGGGIVLTGGANNNQAIPTLTAAASSPGGNLVEGTLAVAAGTSYLVQYFYNNLPSNQGRTFLGSQIVSSSPATTTVNLSFPTAAAVPPGSTVTATATNQATGDTSQFPNAVALVSPFVVTNTRDSGIGSLRYALQAANADVATDDTIAFQIPASDPHYNAATGSWTIPVQAGLAISKSASGGIQHSVVIAGLSQKSQPGAATTHPVIEITPATSFVGDGLTLNSGGNTVQGLVIDGFQGTGLVLNSSANNNLVVGNYVGTDVTGAVAQGNSVSAVSVFSTNNTIGGTTATARNVISGNGSGGVLISGVGATNNVVLGNFIGTDATGERDVPNSANGVLIDGSSNNTIGGTAVGAGNVISGTIGAGVSIDPGATNNLVLGNFIGTDATGELAVPNRANGVLIGESSNNTIGGTAVGARNVISDNIGAGVSF